MQAHALLRQATDRSRKQASECMAMLKRRFRFVQHEWPVWRGKRTVVYVFGG
jgi:hypothetical protein